MEDFNGGRIRFRLDLSAISLNFISIVKGQHLVKFYFRKSRRKAVQKNVAPLWLLGASSSRPSPSLRDWDVSFCRREANTVADQLSKLDFSTLSVFKTVLPIRPIRPMWSTQKILGKYPLTAYPRISNGSRTSAQGATPGSSSAAAARSATHSRMNNSAPIAHFGGRSQAPPAMG